MTLRTLGLGWVLAAAFSGPASAAVYIGNWDPLYGAPFSDDLAWRGTATYFVPDSCEPLVSASIDNAMDCNGGAIVTSATVELYDDDDGDKLLATIVLAPASMTVLTLHYLAGQLAGLDTGLSGFVLPVAEAGVNLGDYGIGVAGATSFALEFTSKGPLLHHQTCSRTGGCSSGVNDAAQFPAQFSITRVPEPASIALTGLALAGLAAARRRRSR